MQQNLTLKDQWGEGENVSTQAGPTSEKPHKKIGTQNCNLLSYIAENVMSCTDNYVPKRPF